MFNRNYFFNVTIIIKKTASMGVACNTLKEPQLKYTVFNLNDTLYIILYRLTSTMVNSYKVFTTFIKKYTF